MTSTLLANGIINSKAVAFFRPPHNEPDFPWVDTFQLASAFLPPMAAGAMLKSTQRFEDGRTVIAIRDGERLTTILCHAMAQGMCGAIDEMTGHSGENGPTFRAYCTTAANIASEHWPMSFGEMMAAFDNVGGPMLRTSEGGK